MRHEGCGKPGVTPLDFLFPQCFDCRATNERKNLHVRREAKMATWRRPHYSAQFLQIPAGCNAQRPGGGNNAGECRGCPYCKAYGWQSAAGALSRSPRTVLHKIRKHMYKEEDNVAGRTRRDIPRSNRIEPLLSRLPNWATRGSV